MKIEIVINKSCVLKNFHLLEQKNPSIIGLLKERCTYKNPDFVRNEKYGYSNAKVPEYLYTYVVIGADIHFPRGIYKEVVSGLKQFGFDVTIINKLNKGVSVTLPSNPVTLRQDQTEALHSAIKNKRGLLKAYTSFGKTPLLIYLMYELKIQTTVVVHTTFLQKQWIKELLDLYKMPKHLIGGCGGFFKKPRIGAINICLYHTLCKPNVLRMYNEGTGVVIAEEVQRSAIDLFSTCIRNFDAEYRLGISANHKRKDGKEFIIEDHMGKVFYEAIEKQSASKILSYITIINTDYYDYDYDWDKNHTGLVSRIARDKTRNTLILKRCIAKTNMGKQVLIIVERKEQCFQLQGALLKKGLKVGVLAGSVAKDDIKAFESNMAKHYASQYDDKSAYDYIKKNAENKNLDVIIGTQKAEVGLSLRTVSHLIISSLVGSNIEDRLNQIVGRVERTHGGELEKLFGVKETPTVDLLMDTKFKHIKKQKQKVKEFYKGRITELGFAK